MITYLISKLLLFSLHVQSSIMNTIEMDNVQIANESGGEQPYTLKL